MQPIIPPQTLGPPPPQNSGAVHTPQVYIEAATSMVEFIRELIEDKRVAPSGDLLSDLIAARDGGDRLTPDELTSMVDLNLTAPLLLTNRVLPGMLERGRGHVVFIASMAGKLGLAYVAPYVATKAGLIGATQSLRAEHVYGPVGFSVVCPGFVSGEGMYQRMLDEGFSSNRLVGSTTIEKVADKVIDAIRRDRPEVIESGGPVRPLLALVSMKEGWLSMASVVCGSGSSRGLMCASGAHLSIASSVGGPGDIGGRPRGRNSNRAVRRPDDLWRRFAH